MTYNEKIDIISILDLVQKGKRIYVERYKKNMQVVGLGYQSGYWVLLTSRGTVRISSYGKTWFYHGEDELVFIK